MTPPKSSRALSKPDADRQDGVTAMEKAVLGKQN
jgi:hypothetical protein